MDRPAVATAVDAAPVGRAPDLRPLVTCIGVARTFSTGDTAVVAVYDVTLTVPRGARVALTGPSGSGKSTLLHMMAGLDAPTAGALRWPGLGGHPLAHPGRVGIVFQGPSLLASLTVAENVALALLLADATPTEATAAAQAALELLGIADLHASLPEELSGGQAQRVAIARVLAARPSLILADEPTGQLDHATAEGVIDVLLATSDELGAALVISTHDPVIAARVSERWTMHDGTLREEPGGLLTAAGR